MSSKVWITIGVIVGSYLGGLIPSLWGDSSIFSLASIMGNLIGGLAGIWLGYKLGQIFS